MPDVQFAAQPWSQATDRPAFLAAAGAIRAFRALCDANGTPDAGTIARVGEVRAALAG